MSWTLEIKPWRPWKLEIEPWKLQRPEIEPRRPWRLEIKPWTLRRPETLHVMFEQRILIASTMNLNTLARAKRNLGASAALNRKRL